MLLLISGCSNDQEESLNESEHTIPSLKKVIPNSTSEGKKQLNSEAYSDGIIMTSADRDFLLIKMVKADSKGNIYTMVCFDMTANIQALIKEDENENN